MNILNKLTLLAFLAASTAIPTTVTHAADVEVEHWYTSSSEAAALAVVKKAVEDRGVQWRDAPVAGGGGDAAMTALRARVQAGDPPGSVQLLGLAIADWAQTGALMSLDDVAAKENWDAVIPKELQAFSKYDGHYVAAPLDMHRANWVWINTKLMEKVGGKAPENFEQLIELGKKFKEAGVVPLAIGGQPWQQGVVFDSAVLAVGGPDFYRKAFVDLDPEALGSDTMVKAFDQLRELRGLVDSDFTNRDWNLAAAMVTQEKAGMQIIGDWAKGEFASAGLTPGKDITCISYPGTQGDVVFLTNQFAMFKDSKSDKQAQETFASVLMDPKVEAEYSIIKGNIPARTDASVPGIDACGQKSIDDRKEALAKGGFMPSMTFNHAAPPAVVGAYLDVVTHFFNSDMSSKDAAAQLVDAVANAQ
ncbi:ABC transporter substrate-binding protein [Rhizobium sp. S152]|uniref:ABC transporter substrate-binding protein n=1 Tax=Rhizobium sp. S152 TaxID=3055038 RepID=UPI0025A9A246|nr:ABC transporter substrate-binding protein [Rhizobium sp. S152]MDM9624706.1 ABC transporter substrate-binding protein [Rhizobium sp. S152]